MIALRRDTYLVPSVWIFSLAAAGLIGYSMAPSPVELPAGETSTPDTNVAAQPESRPRSVRERPRSSGPQVAPDAQSGGLVAMAEGPGRATGADVREALTLTDPIERMAALADLLSRLDADAIEDGLGALTGRSPMGERRSERELLLYAWGQLDGNAAMDYVLSAERVDQGWGRGRGRSRRGGGRDWGQIRDSFSVLSGWVSADADAAVAWVQDNDDGVESPFYIGVVNGLAMTDLHRATGLVTEMPDGRARGRAIDILVDGYMQQGMYAASDWAQSLPSGELKNDVVGHTARRLASLDPLRYADWTLSPVLGEAQADAVTSYARQWSRSDPVTAAEWVTDLADDELRIAGMSEVVASWGRRDPAAAAEWLNQFELGPEMDGLIQVYVDAVDRRDPETAITWALAISDEQRRTELVQNISEQWMRRDPESAEAFLKVQ